MDKKYYVLGGVLALVLVLGMLFPRPGQSVIERVIEKLGANPGTDFSSTFLKFNGIEHQYSSQAFNVASTTLCAFKPGATSTVLRTFINVKNATSSAIVIDLAKSTNPSATTSLLADSFALGANLKANLLHSGVSSTSVRELLDDTVNPDVLGPNDYQVVKFGGGKGPATGTHGIGGNCQFEFIVH